MFVQSLGLGKDELLLLGAVSTSMGTFGYLAVPWGDMMMSPADKALALYEQIEKGNTEYFETYGVWPNEVTSGRGTDNVTVLMSRIPLTRQYKDSPVYQPVIQGGLMDSRPDGMVARHLYGNGGDVRQTALNGGAYRFVIEFDNLSIADARALDKAIDGAFEPSKGRLRIVEGDNGTVKAKYLANPRNQMATR